VAQPAGEALAPFLRAGVLEGVVGDAVPGAEDRQGLVGRKPEGFDERREGVLVLRLPELVDELRGLARGRGLAAERGFHQRLELSAGGTGGRGAAAPRAFPR